MDKPIISFDTARLYVRSVEESDKEAYMNLRVETSEIAQAYQSFPGFRDHEWNEELNSQKDVFMAVFLKENDMMIASASFQNYESDCIELGFDVTERYRKQGIATELVQGMLEIVHTSNRCSFLIISYLSSSDVYRDLATWLAVLLAISKAFCLS